MKLTIYQARGSKRGDTVDVDLRNVVGLAEYVRWRYGERKRVALIRLKDGRSLLVDDPNRKLYAAVQAMNNGAILVRQMGA